MSGLLAAIGLGFIGLAIGAVIQRWGDADRATHGHQDYDAMAEPDYESMRLAPGLPSIAELRRGGHTFG